MRVRLDLKMVDSFWSSDGVGGGLGEALLNEGAAHECIEWYENFNFEVSDRVWCCVFLLSSFLLISDTATVVVHI